MSNVHQTAVEAVEANDYKILELKLKQFFSHAALWIYIIEL